MGKEPATFGRAGVDPNRFSEDPHGSDNHDDDVATNPHGMEEHADDVAADGDAQPPQEHDDTAHALDYLLSEDYRTFVNTTPSTPEDGDVVLNTDGSEVTLEVYDNDAGQFVGVGTSAESYTDADAVAALDAEVDNFASSVAGLDDNAQSHASASNPHSGSLSTSYSAPVQDVNGATGSVNLNYNDVGALADHEYNPEADTHNRPTETQTASKSPGYKEPDTIVTSNAAGSNGVFFRTDDSGLTMSATDNFAAYSGPWGVSDGIRLRIDNEDPDESSTVEITENSTGDTLGSVTVPGGQSYTTYDLNYQPEDIEEIRISLSSATGFNVIVAWFELHGYGVGSHSHQI